MHKSLVTTYTGGMPFVTDDLGWMQEGYIEAMEGILRGMTDGTEANSFVIQGCLGNVATGTITIDAGWLYFEDEIIRVDSHTLTDQGATGTYYWTVVETFDSNGAKVFNNGTTNQTYKLRKGVVAWDAATLTGKSTLARISTFLIPAKSIVTKLSDPYVYGTNNWGLNLTNLNAQNSTTLSNLNTWSTGSAWTVADLVTNGNLVVGGGATYTINTTAPFSQMTYRKLNKSLFIEWQLLLNVTVIGSSNIITFNNPFGTHKVRGITVQCLKKNSVISSYYCEHEDGTDNIYMNIGTLDVLTSTADTIVYGRLELILE